MNAYKRVTWLIAIMGVVSLFTGSIALAVSYQAALEQQRQRLSEAVQAQARLLLAAAQFDRFIQSQQLDGGLDAVGQFSSAHKDLRGFGQTGEFILARGNGDDISYLIRPRFLASNDPSPPSDPTAPCTVPSTASPATPSPWTTVDTAC